MKKKKVWGGMALSLLLANPLWAEGPPTPRSAWCLAQGVELLEITTGGAPASRQTSFSFFWTTPQATGSLTKLFSILALDRAGIPLASATVPCDPSDLHEKASLSCWNHDGHGRLGLPLALAHSCNAFFTHLGQGVPISNLDAAAAQCLVTPRPLPPVATEEERAALWCGAHPDFLVIPGEMALALLAFSGGPFLKMPPRGKPEGMPGEETTALNPKGMANPSRVLVEKWGPAIRLGMTKAAILGTGRATSFPYPVCLKTGTAEDRNGGRRGWAFAAFPPGRPTRAYLLSKAGCKGSEAWALLAAYIKANFAGP